jgi:hypothetical protein
MKTLLTLLLVCLTTFASAQCTSTCSPCTKGQITSVIPDGNDLWVNWNNNWQWGYGCTKGVTILIDGVEYGGNGPFAIGDPDVYTSAHSGAKISGYTVTSGATICVVLRNYCSSPYYCNPTNYVDSDPVCITAPIVSPGVACNCVSNPTKYVISKPGETNQCVTKKNCLKKITQGWTSSCNCQ